MRDAVVTQADREAAAQAFDARARRAGHPATITMERHHAKVIRAGEGDDYDAVQAAVIARLAERERCAKVAEDRAPAVQCMSVEPIVSTCLDIASAIRETSDVE